MSPPASSSHQHFDRDWKLLDQFVILAVTNSGEAISQWLAKKMEPFHFGQDQLKRIGALVLDSRSRWPELAHSSPKLQAVILRILIPNDLKDPNTPGKSTWGFFWIERTGTPKENGSPGEHWIEIYLHPDS